MIGQSNSHGTPPTPADVIARPRKVACQRHAPADLTRHIAALGPRPRSSLETFVDLSLSDEEIAHYFSVPRSLITQLRDVWGIRA